MRIWEDEKRYSSHMVRRSLLILERLEIDRHPGFSFETGLSWQIDLIATIKVTLVANNVDKILQSFSLIPVEMI